MAYTINLTDGAIFATIPDGDINDDSSMILVGKNYAGYGEFLNQNFIHLLENGSNNTPPSAPLRGQLWWDKSTSTMKVYNGAAFKVISGATASASAPTSNVPGDFWWDTINAQLKVWNGTSFTLIGPATSGPGVSGAIVTTVSDSSPVPAPHVIVQLVVDNTIVAIVSKDPTFTPSPVIPGFGSGIGPGIQLSGAVANKQFRGTAENALRLADLLPTQFLRSDQAATTSGTLGVLNDSGFVVGVDSDARISVFTATSEVIIDNVTNNANLSMRVNVGGTATTVMRALGTTGEVTFPAAAGVSVTGNITVPQIVKSGANNSGNIGSATNVFNTVFANTFQGTVATANNVSGTVAVANGGTGRNILNPNAVILGNGTANVNFVDPGLIGNVLTSNGTTWISQAGGGGGGNVVSVTATAGTPISVGGTASNPIVGINSVTANSVILGNGTSSFQTVAPVTNGHVLTVSGGTWVSAPPAGGGGTSIANGASNVTVIAPNGNILANVNGVTIHTISSTGVNVDGRVIATGNVFVDAAATRGIVNDTTNNQVGMGITGGTNLLFKSTSPTGNIDIIAGNTVSTGNIIASGLITGNGFLSTNQNFNFDSVSSIYKQGSNVRIDINSAPLVDFKIIGGTNYQVGIANQDLGMAFDSVTGAFGVGRTGGPAWLMTGSGLGGNISAVAGNVIIGGSGKFVGNIIGQLHNFSGNTATYGTDLVGSDFTSISLDVVGSGRRMDLTTTRNRMYQVTAPFSDNSYTIGASGARWSQVWAADGTIQTSDERLKTDVTDSALGLSFIDRLRPVSYRWIVGENVEDGFQEEEILDDDGNVIRTIRIPTYRPRPGVRTHYGLISQEVKAALDQEDAGDFAGWVLSDKHDPSSEQCLNYSEFIAPMIRAIQELKAELDATRAQLTELQGKIE